MSQTFSNSYKNWKHTLIKKWESYKEFRLVFLRFFPYIRKSLRRLFLAQLAGLGYLVMGMLEPWSLKLIFDNVLLKQELPAILQPLLGAVSKEPLVFLNVLIAAIIIIAFIRGIFYYYQQLLTTRAGQQITASIREELFSHLQRLSFSFHDHRRTGDLLTRLTTDIRVLRNSLVSFPLTITNELCLMTGMIIVMFFMDWHLTLIALLVIPILTLLLKKYQNPLKKAIRKEREREGNLVSLASEVLGAIKVVQGFHQEKNEIERFIGQNKDTLNSGLKAARLEVKLRWAADLAVALVTIIVLSIAVRRVIAGMLSPGDILVFMAYLKTFTRPLQRISRVSEQMVRTAASGERIYNMLKIAPTIKDRVGAVAAGRLKGEIYYKNVSFRYSQGPLVLTNITFSIRPEERIVITGPTGCGKSTLCSLLPRFYDPTQGAILMDGKDIRDFKLFSLRQNISLVFQEPILFATTIAENIAYGKPDATLEEIKETAQKAGIHRMIESLPEGYETLLGERGGTISGGQRQCIAIARAIIKNAGIVILDEPTTGLDRQSAMLVMKALKVLMNKKTVIMISHQFDIIQDVDRVVVLREGRIVQDGPPSQVLVKKEFEQELYQHQSGKGIA